MVVEKPINVPMCEDSSKDLDLLTMLKDYLKKQYQKKGNVFLALVHRLDRPVSGVCVFAKTSKAASRLSAQIQDKTFKKTYLSVVIDEKNVLKESGTFKDHLLKDTKKNITKVDEKGKLSILSYDIINRKKAMVLVKIDLKTGRSHQIRVQFSSRGFPLYGDQKYNGQAKVGQQLALFSHKLVFVHPITKNKMEFMSLPKKYPFNIFGGQNV